MEKSKKPKIIFVLSRGLAAKGLAHLGVLQVLDKEGIKPDAIVGTSVGSLIGGLYAAGVDLKKAEEAAIKINKLQKVLLFTSLPRRTGLVRGDRIEELIKKFIGQKKIEELNIPFYAVATDIGKGERVVINKGPLVKAIRASISIPGVFPHLIR